MYYSPRGKLCKHTKWKIITIIYFISLLFIPSSAYGESFNQTNVNNPPDNSKLLLSDNKKTEEKTEFAVTKLQGEIKQEQIPAQEPRLDIWLKQDKLTGNWSDYRDKLDAKGINFSAIYVDDFFQKISGGSSRKNPLKYNGFIKSNVEFDTQKLGLWSGGKAHFTLPYKFGEGLSDYMQTKVSYSNINARRFISLGEFWYEQSLLSDTFKIKIGKQDLENDYAVLNDSYNFINGGLSENPTIPLPAITRTAIGISTTISPIKSIKLKTGIFDGNARRESLGFGTLFTGKHFDIIEGEADYSVKNLPGTTKIGGWYHNGDIDKITSNSVSRHFQSNYGVYSATKQMIFKENDIPNDHEGLSAHILFGWSPADRNELSQFYGFGVQYKGLLANRNNDIIGIGTNFAKLSNRIASTHGKSKETSLEGFYKIQITKFFALQPDFQVIFNPNGNGKTAWLLGMRTFISF